MIDLPDKNKKGVWSTKYAERLEQATMVLENCNNIATKITTMKSKATRNIYTLEVYEQVNELVLFAPKALLALKAYDVAQNKQQKLDAIRDIKQISEDFGVIRKQLERIYGKTRVLTKTDNYLLHQEHHSHLSNQTISFDCQFFA